MKVRVYAALFFALSVSACSTSGEVKPVCPQTAILRELETMSDYGGESPNLEALVAIAKMNNVDGSCEYSEGGVEVDFMLSMSAEKNDRLGGNRIGFPFFVSVVSPDGKVLSKELMTADFVFEDGKMTADRTENIRAFVPLEDGADGVKHRVLMGFQLTEEQLEAARKADESLGR